MGKEECGEREDLVEGNDIALGRIWRRERKNLEEGTEDLLQ